MGDINEINRQLAAVVDELNATPSTDFARRHELRTRQDELRELAAQHRTDFDDSRSSADLEAELAARRAQLDALAEAGIDLVTQAGGGSGTAGSYTSASEGALNAKIREANDADTIRARIAKLEELLRRRRHEAAGDESA